MLEIPEEMDFDPHTDARVVRPLSAPTQLAIVMPTWVGDACMATPTLRAIRERYPLTKIILISRPVIRDVVLDAWGQGQPWFDDSLLVTKQGGDGVHTRLSLTKAVRSAGVNAALLLTNSFWSAAAMKLAGVRRVIGYQRDARGWLLSDRVPVLRTAGKPRPISAVDYYLELARWIGCDIRNRSMQLGVTEAERQRADELYRRSGLNPKLPTLVVNSNAATERERLWPEACVRELALRAATELGLQVLLHCGPQEREMSNRIVAEVNHSSVASMGAYEHLPISLSRAVLERAAVVVSTDSGPRHIAVALNRQVVTLYGPTSPVWTTTYNRPEIALQSFVDGSPSMAHITVDEVLNAVRCASSADISNWPLAA